MSDKVLRSSRAAAGGQGSSCAQEAISLRASKRSHNAAVSVFSLCKPHISYLENTQPLPHSVFPQGSLLFVFVIIRLILTCLCDSTGVHTSIERGKTEVSIANLLKGKRDSHWFFPLWPDFHLENRILTLCVPEENDFFVCFKFRNGFFTGGMS